MSRHTAIPHLFWLICPQLLEKKGLDLSAITDLFGTLSAEQRARIMLLYRGKTQDPEIAHSHLQWLTHHLPEGGRQLMTYGDPKWVQDLGLAGLHCPDQTPLAPVRQALGPNSLLGCSRHQRTLKGDEGALGADYLFFSPVFQPISKTSQEEALGLPHLSAAIAQCQIPVIGLGGMVPEHAQSVRGAGAHGLAFMGAPFESAEPNKTLQEFLARL